MNQSIFNTTYTNKEYNRCLKEKLGKKFSFVEKIKLGGVGSGKFIVSELSAGLQIKVIETQDIVYANIELRRKGIIVHFTKKQYNFSWLIEYDEFNLVDDEYFTVRTETDFIQFFKNKYYEENLSFIKKLLDFKQRYSKYV